METNKISAFYEYRYLIIGFTEKEKSLNFGILFFVPKIKRNASILQKI